MERRSGFAGFIVFLLITICGSPLIAQPTDHLRVEPELLWRIGSGKEDVLFGYVSEVTSDSRGNLYVLDGQLLQVIAFSPDGKLIAKLTRGGEGPGEIQRPIDLMVLPGGTLGVVEGFPAKVVRFDFKGNPLPSISVGKDGAAGTGNLFEGSSASDHLVLCGRSQELRENGFDVTEYLARFSSDGRELTRYLELSYFNSVVEPTFNEKDRHFVKNGRWTVGPNGEIYAAPSHQDYEIRVWTSDGTPLRVIRRAFESRPRSDEELAALSKGPAMMVNGRRLAVKATVEKRDPSIKSLRATGNGELWVLNSWGDRGREPDAYHTYDVFDEKGEFRRNVSLIMEGNPQEDRLFWVSDDRFVILRETRIGAEQEGEGSFELMLFEIPR